MKSLALYLLQVIVASGILYAYYHFVLRNKKFHQYNRFYLLGSVVIALLIPFLNIAVYFTASQEQASPVLRTLRAFYFSSGYATTGSAALPVTRTVTINWVNLLSAGYLLISLVFFFRIILSLRRIGKIIRSYPAEELEGVRFVNTNEPGTPFSFFRWLFWDKKIELLSDKGQQIFRHEIFHIQQRHTWDLLFMEVITTFCWINPFFHLIKKELSTIHEFLADQYAVNEERKWDYAELLLMQALSTHELLVNPFFNNQIKRRIAMITTSTRSGYQYLRKLMVLPVAAITIVSLAFTYKTKETKKSAPQSPSVSTQTFEDTPKRKAVLFWQKDSIIVKADNLVFDPPLASSFKSNYSEMLIIVNGEKRPYTFLKDHVVTAQTINVFDKNNAHAMALYGKEAANGVIAFERATIKPASPEDYTINTKLDEPKPDRITVKDSLGKITTDLNINPISDTEIRLEGNIQFYKDFSLEVQDMTIKYPKGMEGREAPFEPQLVIVNDERFTPAQAGARFNGSVVKSGTATIIADNDDAAIEKYGTRARNGVLVINATIVKTGAVPVTLVEDDANPMFEKVEIEAEYPGGAKAWNAYLKKTVVAETAAKNGAPANVYTVSIQFLVNKDGTLSDIKPLSDNGYGMEQEIVRAITKSPKWLSAIQNGRKVTVYRKVNYTFNVAKASSEVPKISLRSLREPDKGKLLGVENANDIVSFKFTIDKEDGSIAQSINTGKVFNSSTRKLVDEATAGHLITFEEIYVMAGGKKQRHSAKVYELVD